MFISNIRKFNFGKSSIEQLSCGIFHLILYPFHDIKMASHMLPNYLLFVSLLMGQVAQSV